MVFSSRLFAESFIGNNPQINKNTVGDTAS